MTFPEYKPYYDLLVAICNSDNEERDLKSVVVVYDMYEKEKLIAVFTKTEYAAKFFKTSREVINCCISRRILRNERYKIERVYYEKNEL